MDVIEITVLISRIIPGSTASSDGAVSDQPGPVYPDSEADSLEVQSRSAFCTHHVEPASGARTDIAQNTMRRVSGNFYGYNIT